MLLIFTPLKWARPNGGNIIFRFEREKSTTRGREKERERPPVPQGARPYTVNMGGENEEKPAHKVLQGRAHDEAALDRFKDQGKR